MSSTDNNSRTNRYHDIMEDARGPASEKQDRSARNKFDHFLRRQGFTDGYEEVRKRHVTKQLIGEFSDYLLQDSIGYQSTMNYLSSIRKQLEKKTKTTLFKNEEQWYHDLRNQIHKQYVTLCIKTGAKLKDPAPAMTVEDLKIICKVLFMKGVKDHAAANRMLMNQQWLALGRSSDVGHLRYEDLINMDG